MVKPRARPPVPRSRANADAETSNTPAKLSKKPVRSRKASIRSTSRSPTAKIRRSPRSRKQAQVTDTNGESSASAPTKRKPTRKAKGKQPVAQDELDSGEQDQSTVSVSSSKGAKRGKKRRQGGDEDPLGEEQEIGALSRPKRARKARVSSRTLREATGPDDGPSRGRDRADDDDQAESEFEDSMTKGSSKSKRRKSADADVSQLSTASSNRRRSGQSIDADNSMLGEPVISANIPHIAPRIKRIPQSVMTSKWTPLNTTSRTAVASILHLASQPALSMTGTNEFRHRAGAVAIRAVSKRIINQLNRGLPFPPASVGGVPTHPSGRSRITKDSDGGRADELHFDKVAASVKILEGGLDSLLHSVALLEREKETIIAQIEKEKKAVSTLEAAAKKEANMWKESLRKAHVLAPGEKLNSTTKDEVRLSTFKPAADTSLINPFSDLANITPEDNEPEDVEIRDLARQVSSHMESIGNNMNQIDGVIPQIGKTRAALQAVLGKALSEEVMAGVLLG